MKLRASKKLHPLLVATAALLTWGAFAAQKSSPKGSVDSQAAARMASVARGHALFHDKCEICHFSNSEAQKLGPGMKGIYVRGKFADGRAVTDALMEKWISDGSSRMPSYGKILNSNQIRDLIQYIRIL
jgi:mono/diheme cytochrome c family protein